MDKFQYNFEDVEIPDFRPEFFSLWLEKVVNSYGKSLGEISFIFCSDEYLLDVNREHLDHDFYTDIITFNYNEADEINGDLFISWDRVKENALEFGNGDSFDELCRVMVHGVLHLIGFNDKNEEEVLVMRKEETKNLSLR